MKDGFGREHVYLRLAVTDRCNLRCAYCMPARTCFRPRDQLLGLDELERLLRVFGRLGIRKVRLTGGEPTVRPDLVELCEKVAATPGIETLALTTNGVRLGGLAGPIYRAGVRRLNLSLDTVRPERFRALTGRDALGEVLEGLEAALAAGFAPVKLNAVVMAGVNDDELLELVELARERPVEVRFIEFMPFKANGWAPRKFVPATAMIERVRAAHPLVPLARHAPAAGVAKDFRIPGFRGRVCFITPFSDSFCARCNRLRVTADGQLKTCLFSAPEVDLRAALRRGASDEELAGAIVAALGKKPRCHPPLEEVAGETETLMNVVGG